MKRLRINPNSKFYANCFKWLAIVLIVVAGVHYFELVKQYYLFIALAALVLLLFRR